MLGAAGLLFESLEQCLDAIELDSCCVGNEERKGPRHSPADAGLPPQSQFAAVRSMVCGST
jgi:hypothetical protein